jgi:hypothetical protein
MSPGSDTSAPPLYNKTKMTHFVQKQEIPEEDGVNKRVHNKKKLKELK